MVFRKLRNLVSRQAHAAASKETANNQPSSDNEQPEPILGRSPCSLPTAAEVPEVPGRFLTVKQMKFPSVLLLTVKGENKIPKFKTIQTPSDY